MTIKPLIIGAASAALLVACGGSDVKVSSSGDTATEAAIPAKDIRVVGSSTVYPFSTKVAQEFKNKTGYNVVVEATGMNMELKDVYLALAKEVPTSDTDCTMQANPYTQWSEINSSLPNTKIEAFGPPPTSGTRDAFVEIAMEGGAKEVACLAELRNTDKKAFATIAHTVREDGYWIDGGENDNAVVQTLVNTPTAIGIFGYSFLDQNSDKIKGANIGSAEPTFEKIASGEYPVSRSLYFYVKNANTAVTPGLQGFALEFTSDTAAGPGGYLEEIGLVPLPDAQRAQVRSDVENMTPYSQ